MIVLFTDFGYPGPYAGQMKAVLTAHAPSAPVIDLMHDAPAFNPKASSYLLASLVNSFPKGSVFLCVVDPGVGDEARQPCIVKADGNLFVGPDNGLFNAVIKQSKKTECWHISWKPKQLSSSFHGRDLFAPVAAMLANNTMPDSTKIDTLECYDDNWQDDLNEIIYIDHYGNCMTGVRAVSISSDSKIALKDKTFTHANTFSDVNEGEVFWYENSNGLVELAVNQGSAAGMLGLSIGDSVSLA